MRSRVCPRTTSPRIPSDPKNIEPPRKLREARHELARVLGHAHHADYVTKDKMVGTARTAADFVRKVTKASEARAQKDYDLLLARKRQDDPPGEAPPRAGPKQHTGAGPPGG